MIVAGAVDEQPGRPVGLLLRGVFEQGDRLALEVELFHRQRPL
jgi:hypothetical protein